MRIIPLINYLKTNVPLLNEHVEPATSLLAPDEDEIEHDLPLCFVHPWEDKFQPNETMGVVEQDGFDYFRLMYAANNIDLDAEEEPLEDLREQVDSVLLGWSYNGAHGAVEKVGGHIDNINNSTVFWIDVYRYERCVSG